LRSKLVHGGQIKQKDLRTELRKLSTMPQGATDGGFGVAIGYAVDRMRDLVRRAILARLCLAAGPDPLWPFDGSTGVDSLLSDDGIRPHWRERWHQKLAALGIEDAANPPPAAVDFLTPHEQEDQARRKAGANSGPSGSSAPSTADAATTPSDD
jgi:hypothetical protein